jgi:hypothetical protein
MPQSRFVSASHRYFYASLVMILSTLSVGHAADFFCPAGNVTCLIASINEANRLPGEHAITLDPASYTFQAESGGGSALPVITGKIRIQPSAENPTTVIGRDPAAGFFNIFNVARGGSLHLIGITILRADSGHRQGGAISNSGDTTLENSSVVESSGEQGAVYNSGTFRALNSFIINNFGGHDGGGIVNDVGNVLLENSTVAHNSAIGTGGITSFGGNLVIKNSSIVFNSGNCCEIGGGIANLGGSVQITNTTVAKNRAGIGGGAGVWNSGVMTITNSTIRENHVFATASHGGGILNNTGGTVRLQNTIVAGNTVVFTPSPPPGPDCIGNVESLGNNLIGDPSDCGINLQLSDITGDPGLGDIAGTGEEDLPGKTFYPLMSGSPVINAGNAAACPVKDQLGNPRVGRCDIGAVEFQERMLVSVDIRPRSEGNKINPHSNQNINVAILSINDFDATTVDPSTVRFGVKGTEASPIHVRHRDVDGDGRIDQILRFEIQDTGIECGDTSGTLTGETVSGTSIIGSGPIKTTQCKKPKKNVAL